MKAVNIPIANHERNAVCETHGEYLERGAVWAGQMRWFGCDDCRLARQEREKKAEGERQYRQLRDKEIQQVLERFQGIGIPARFQSRTFANYRADADETRKALQFAKAYAQQFEKMRKNGASLILCGSPGTGKTHLAAAVANEIYADYLVLFRGVLAAVRHVKNTWSRSSEQSEADAIADLVKPDLLILDDVGVQFGSEAEKIILFEIINGRYEQMKPTIITANLTTSELANYLGERVMDRLTEGGGAVIAFDWDSYRSKVAKDPALNGRQNETETEAA